MIEGNKIPNLMVPFLRVKATKQDFDQVSWTDKRRLKFFMKTLKSGIHLFKLHAPLLSAKEAEGMECRNGKHSFGI